MFHPRGASCYITYNWKFSNSRSTLEYQISIGIEMVFSSNFDKMSKMIF